MLDNQFEPVLFDSAFSADALCYSDTAKRESIDNTCPAQKLPNLAKLSRLLGELQRQLNCRVKINSGYRCETLNAKVGGVENSQHTQGLAADIVSVDYASAYDFAEAIATSSVQFDQLILEFGRWVHISVSEEGKPAREEVLTIRHQSEGYLEGLIG